MGPPSPPIWCRCPRFGAVADLGRRRPDWGTAASIWAAAAPIQRFPSSSPSLLLVLRWAMGTPSYFWVPGHLKNYARYIIHCVSAKHPGLS
jgi:hypothetical protein